MKDSQGSLALRTSLWLGLVSLECFRVGYCELFASCGMDEGSKYQCWHTRRRKMFATFSMRGSCQAGWLSAILCAAAAVASAILAAAPLPAASYTWSVATGD